MQLFMHSDAARLHLLWQGDCWAKAKVAATTMKKGKRMELTVARECYGKHPMTPTEAFEDAQQRIKQLKESPGNDALLELYAFFKQATAGDVTGSRPGMMDFKGRAKFDAWTKKKGTSKDAAMSAYVVLVDRLSK